jgi:hypothetical protein
MEITRGYNSVRVYIKVWEIMAKNLRIAKIQEK